MAVDRDDITKMAKLAKLSINDNEIEEATNSIRGILDLVDKMQAVDTDNVTPLSNALDATQRLRVDNVTESDQRDDFQRIAPQAEQGFYLVPKVIE